MTDYIVTDTQLTNLANSIRDRAGSAERYTFPFSVNNIPRPYGGFVNGSISRIYFNTDKITDADVLNLLAFGSYPTTWAGQIDVTSSGGNITAVDAVSGETIGKGFYEVLGTGNYFQWLVPYIDLATPFTYSEREGIFQQVSLGGNTYKRAEFMMFSSIPVKYGYADSSEVDELNLVASLKTTRKLKTVEDVSNVLNYQAFLPDNEPAEFDFALTDTTLTLYITLVSTEVTITWGDGTAAQTVSSSGSVAHTYSSTGEYTVKIYGSFSPGATISSNNYGLLGQVKTSKAGTFPQLVEARLSKDTIARSNGFFNCTGLRSVSMISDTTANGYLSGCTGLIQLAQADGSPASSNVKIFVSGQTTGFFMVSEVERVIFPRVSTIDSLQAVNITQLALPATCQRFQTMTGNNIKLTRVDILAEGSASYANQPLNIDPNAFINCLQLQDVYVYRDVQKINLGSNAFPDNITFHVRYDRVAALQTKLVSAGITATVVAL